MEKSIRPPGIFLRFFRWYCHPTMQDYIEGDLMEVYARRVKQAGENTADFRFVIDVLLLFRPGIVRSMGMNRNVNNYGMFKSYFKIGWRNLIRNKAYALINIAGLTLSMACGILIFAFIKHHTSFDNFHADGDRLYRIVTELHRDDVDYRNSVPSPLGEMFRSDYTFGEKVARVFTQHDFLVTIRQEKENQKFKETDGFAFTEPSFFDIFNFPFVQGNPSTAISSPNQAILTERVAKKYFGDADAIGKTIWLQNKIPFTVTAILKDLPDNTDFRAGVFVSYSSLKDYDPWLGGETSGWSGLRDGMKCYTVLRQGVSPGAVEQALDGYVKKYRPNSRNVHQYKLQPLAEVHFDAHYGGSMTKQNLWILGIVGVFLLATACMNFVNLATAQALRRAKEIGVRKVLGSVRKQLFWQFIFETAIITSIGIFAAVSLASVVAPYAGELFDIPFAIHPFTDVYLIYFIFALGVLVTLLAGYYPAVVLANFQPVTALKGKLTQQHVGGLNTRKTLIVSQFAISQVLIIGMVVVISQIRFAKQSDLGFDQEAIVMVPIDNNGDHSKLNALKNEVLRIPGVDKVSLCYAPPASEWDWGNSIRFEQIDEEVNFRTSIKAADADYLSTFGIALVAGRNMTPSDTCREMLVNEELVRRVGLTPEEALGKIITANGGEMRAPIVGVMKDFHDKSFHEKITPILITTSMDDYYGFAIKLNVSGAKAVLSSVERLWREQYPDQIFEAEFVDDSIAKFYATEDTMLKLIQVFSFLSIFIGCLGLYGLVSFTVSQKTKEIGIRKVLGGSVSHILWIFWKEFAQLVVIAFLIAAPAGWWLMRSWLQDFQFQIPIRVSFFIIALAFSLIIALLTVSYQVVKASIANPVKSLRTE